MLVNKVIKIGCTVLVVLNLSGMFLFVYLLKVYVMLLSVAYCVPSND
jgi:hypothetical protein